MSEEIKRLHKNVYYLDDCRREMNIEIETIWYWLKISAYVDVALIVTILSFMFILLKGGF